MSFCSGSLTLFPSSDPHPISPNNNTALGLSLRAGCRGLIDPEEIPGWLIPCLLEWMCTLFWLVVIITGKEFSIKRLLPRLIKWWCRWCCERSDRNFDSAPVNFRARALRICDIAKDCTSRSLCIFFSSSILKSCFLWQCYRCEFGHHKESFVYVSTCQSEVRFLMLIVMLWSSFNSNSR